MFASGFDMIVFNIQLANPSALGIATFSSLQGASNLTNYDAISAPETNNKLPHVGKLPVDVFIDVIIGAIIGLFLLCFILPRCALLRDEYNESKSSISSSTPSFMDTRPTVSVPNIRMALGELKDLEQPDDASRNGLQPSPVIRPDLPIPIPEHEKSQNPEIDAVTSEEIYECENLIREKLHLDVKIRSLEGLSRRNTASGGALRSRLVQALNRRSELERVIMVALARFGHRRDGWDTEEWQTVQSIYSLFQISQH